MDRTVNPTDEISVEALKTGDQAEFARLVERYSGHIYRLALRILNDVNDAEDVLQETFLKAFRSIQSFEGRSNISTWLYRIAANEALMIVRKRKPLRSLEDRNYNSDEDLDEPVQIVDWCCLPEDEFQSNEAKEFMEKAIRQLSPSLRVVFVLRDIEGFSIKETADALGIQEGAVKTRLLRARLHLREALSGYFGKHLAEN